MGGEIPESVLSSLKEQTNKELASNQSGLSEEDNLKYIAMSNFALKQAMLSGKVYFNDEFSVYLGKIVDRLLKDEPELRSSIKIYATRLPIPNASAWRNGVIFFNIPLLYYMESEAQIAFVLAHEIAHYKRQHTLQQYQKKIDLNGAVYNNSETVNQLFELMRFSRKNELQADEDAFDMLLKTDYAPVEALGALNQLAEINVSTVSFKYKIADLFQLPDSLYDFTISCDSSKYLGEETPMGTEDSLSTHPDIEKRIEIITEKLGQNEPGTDKALFIEGEETFETIREMAYIEQIQNFYDKGSYVLALYGSLQMATFYPDMQYLQELSAKSLYWISKYSTRRDRKVIVPDPKDHVGSYAMFCCYFYRKNPHFIRALSRVFMENRLEKFPDSEVLHIQLAKLHLVDSEEGKAREAFSSYLAQFPDGKFAPHARLKLEELKNKK